ncbi:MAG: murein biosynthesis integral membrane protein MurJ [Anaerolineaceae bacterium]|nr:murein biosynthesis integral membrane protein MurJ [Anaerolineaceae bacterium]
MTRQAAPPEPPDIQETRQESELGVARATGLLALGNVSSRALGLAREVTLANLFGASAAIDAYNVAVIAPRALYDLLIAGHVNSAIIPVLSEVVTRDGRREMWRLFAALFSVVTVLLALLVLALEFFAPQVVTLFGGGGLSPQTFALATALLRLTAPALLFLGWFSLFAGALYALRLFLWPAFAGVVFNAGIVLTMLALVPPLQPVAGADAAAVGQALARPQDAIMVAALGWLAGALLQMALQFPGLWQARLQLQLVWRHPALRQIARLYAPVMFSLLLDALVIRAVSYNLATRSPQGEGALGYMAWATTLTQFPQGLVATAISLAILPTLSRQATRMTKAARAAFRDTLGLGLRLAITLILPATTALFVLATPVIVLLFEHGAFTAADTAITATALRLYLPGLPFAALDLLLVYAFYARQDTLTPALVGALSLAVYLLVALLLFPTLGLYSLMIADSVKHFVHAAICGFILARRVEGLGRQRLWATFVRSGLASLVTGLVVWLLLPPLTLQIGSATLLAELLLLLLGVGVFALAFALLAWGLRLPELRWLWRLVTQRIRGDAA